MRRLTILSVDWDYFFPDPTWYDWSHNEESGLFYEIIWSTRPGNRNIMTGEVAYEKFIPDQKLLDGFWDRVLSPSYPLIFVCESHKTLGEVLSKITMPMDIWNFDQHHDLGYDDRKEMDCGNWATYVLNQNKRSKYNLVYPPWRKDAPEAKNQLLRLKYARNKGKPPLIHRNLPVVEPPTGLKPDVLFVCRSSCWTPSWADEDWLEFLDPLEKLGHGLPWKGRKTVEFVTKARQPGKAEAKVIADQWGRVNQGPPSQVRPRPDGGT